MESIARVNKQVRPAAARCDASYLLSNSFECAGCRGADGDHTTSSRTGSGDDGCLWCSQTIEFLAHTMLLDLRRAYRLKRAPTDVESNSSTGDLLLCEPLQEFRRKVQTSGWRSHSPRVAGIHSLIACEIKGVLLYCTTSLDIRW